MNTGERLRQIRKFLKLNQDEFAEELGMHLRSYQRFESGERQPPAKALQALNNLGFDVNWVLTGAGEMHRRSHGLAEEPAVFRGKAEELGAGFVLVPRLDIQTSAGSGAWVDREQAVDFLAFREAWVRRVLRTDPANLVLIEAWGDSMDPTIRSGDLLLIDRAVDRVVDDAIYVLVISGNSVVKRVQRFADGALTVKSDNRAYADEPLTPEKAADLRVAGRVRWIGRLI